MGEWFELNGPLLGLALLDGIASAALIFMVAVGLNLVFGVLRILNIAHGSLFAIGAYAAASIGLFLASAGLPGWVSLVALLLAAILVGLLLGPLVEWLLLRRILSAYVRGCPKRHARNGHAYGYLAHIEPSQSV